MIPMPVASRLSPTASYRLIVMAETILAAGDLARRSLRRRTADQMLTKQPRDYQTEIDTAVEREIVARLGRAFPDYTIRGEEAVDNRIGEDHAPVIHIDPIDGTTNYAWGLPHFGITIAIVEAGDVVAGVVYDPMLDELFSAEVGGGGYMNGERLACATVAEVENVLVGAGLPVPGQVRAVSEEVYFTALRRLMAQTSGVRRLGSAALSIAYVANGRLDGFFEDGLSLHDYGAAALVLREAGGLVTGFHGGAVGHTGDILAATPDLHSWLVDGFIRLH